MAYSNYNFSGADFFYAQKQARDRIEKETGTQATQAQVDEALKNNRGYQNYANNAVQQQQQAAKNIDYWTKKYNTGLSDTTDENGVTRRTWTGQVKDPSTGKTTRQTVDVSTTQQYQERYQQYQKNLAAERQKKLTDQYNGIVDRLTKTGSESEKRVSQYQKNVAETEKKYGALEDRANRIRRDYGLDPIEKKQSGKVAGFDLVTEADLKSIDLAADSVEAHIQMAGRGDNYQAREESLKDLSRATDKYEWAYDKVEIYNRQNDYVRDNASEEQGKQLLQQIDDYDKQAAAAKTAAEAERARQLADRARELLEINDYYKNKAAVAGRMSDEEFSSTYTAQNLADSDELLAEATALLQQADRALNAGDSVAYNRLVQQAQALREQAYGMVGGDAEARNVVEKRLQIIELESGVEKGRDYLKYVNLGEQKNFIPQLREAVANRLSQIGFMDYAKDYISEMTPTERNTYYYYLGRNDEAKAQQYFSAIEPVLEQRFSEASVADTEAFAAKHPVLGVVFNAISQATVAPIMGAAATAQNISGDAITSGAIYQASDAGQGTTAGLAENIQKNFNASEESAAFWANNIVSMANNLAQTAVFRAGAFAGGAEAMSKVNEWMPLILMSTNAATETVRQELAEGSSAGKALLYGAAVGGAEMLTEKMGLDSWFDLASGKTGTTFLKYITKNGVDLGGLRGAVQAVLGIGQQAITEGTEELISTFTSAVADVLINGESASLIQNQRQYITEGATKEEAFRKAMLDFAKEATESFAGGAVSGGVFGVTGAVGSLRNSNAIGEAVQSMGNAEVYALVEYGNEFAEGTKTHEIASRLTKAINQNENYMPSAGVLTELSLAMESDAKTAMASLSKESTTAAAPTKEGAGGLSVTASGLISTGMVTATEAKAMNTVLNKVATNQKVTDAELHVLRASSPKIRETLSNMMGVEIVDGSDGAMRAAIQVFQQRQAASQKQKDAATKASQILKPAVAVAKGKERVAVQAEVDAAMASAESYANAEAEVSGIEELAAFEAESAYEASEAPAEAKADEAPAASINYAEFSEEYRQSHPKATQEEIMTAYKAAEKSGKTTAPSKKMTAQDITVEQLMEEAERQGTPMSREVAESYVATLKGSDKQFSLEEAVEEAVEAAQEAAVSTVKEGSGTEGKYSKEKPNYVAEWLARDFRKLFGKYIKSVEVRYDLPTGAGAPRGWNAGGKIVLNGQLGDTTVDGVFRSAQDILVYTLSHEVGHSAQGNTSAGYDAQTDAIIQMYRDLNPRFTDAQLEERINKEIAKNRNFARKMELAGEDAGFKASDFGRTEAREEVACNMLGEMMVDYNVLSKMMPQHKTIVQRAQTRVSDVLKAIRKLSPKASKSGEISIAKAYELAAEEIEQTLTDALEAASAKETVDGQNKVWYNDERGGDNYARTDEFRELQAESQGMPDAEWHRNLRGGADADVRRRVSDVLRRQLDAWRRSSGADHGLLNLESKGNQFNIYEDVNGALFHDVFEVARKYLKNGELVDLHTTETTEDGIGYDDCYNYLSEDGLCGFSITPSGDLISVFNMGGQGGFLRAIAPVVRDRAKTLDCYASSNQNLVEMYKKTFGFQAASVMDYNMEYDHDNIAANHGMPQVAFMVNTPAEVVTKHFNGDQYDEAVAYRDSYVNTGVQFSLPDDPDTVVYNRTAILKGETIDRYLKDYAAPGTPNYAQAYIAYMDPDDFLYLTTTTSGRYRIEDESRPLNEEEFAEFTSQQVPIQLRINHETGEVEGHEGRHRCVALRDAGIERVPVLMFDSSNKYNKEPIGVLRLTGQFNRYAQSYVHDMIPLSYGNRDEVIQKFGTQPSSERFYERYRGQRTLRYSISDDELDYLMNDFGDNSESAFERFGGETYDSGTPYVSYDASQRMARDLLNEYGSAADVSDIAAKYRQLSTLTEPVYEWALDVWRGGSLSYDAAAAAQDEILSIASEMADIVIDNASAESQSNEEVREYLRDVLSQKVYVSDADKRDVAMAMGYESWGELRKARFGVLGNTTSDPAKGIEVADIYNGILETFPGAVKGYATEQAGQLAEIIEAYDNAREARDSEFNPLEAEREQYRDEIAGRIYRDLHDKAVDYADEQHKQELALEQARARRLERQARESEKKAAEAKSSNADPKLIENLEAEANDLRTEAEDARLMGQTDSETIAEGMAEGGFTPKTQLQLWEEQSNAKDGKTLTAQERMDQIVKEILERNNKAKQTKVSRTYSNTLVGGGFISEAEQGIEGLRAEDATYDVVSEKESLSEAKNRLDKNYVYWYDGLPKREKWSGKDLDTAMLIFGQVQSESAASGDYSESIRWAQLIREKGTQGGQFLQAFRKYTKTTIGQVIDKTKDLDERYINEKGDNAALDDLRKQNKKAAKDLDQLTIDNEKLDKEYDELMERYNALRSELEEARKERNSTKGKILRAIDKTDALDKENIRLQSELDRLEDLLSWKLAEVSTVSRENRNLVVQSRRLASRLQRAQQRLSDATTRNEQLREALAKLQAETTEASDLLRRITSHNRDLENQIAALSGEVTGAKRTKKAVDNASTAEGVRKAMSKSGSEALSEYLKDIADALDSALTNDKKAALINEMAQFASTLDACKEGDKGSLIDLILRQAAVRNTPVSRGIKKSMEAQEWQFLHDVALTQMMNIAEDYKKVAVGKKLAGWQYLVQLLNPKTSLRNVGSNTVFYGQEAMAKNLGAVIDAITGKATGVRTVGASTFRRGDTGRLSAARDRARRSAIEVSLDVSVGSSNKYTGSNRTFKRSQKGLAGAIAKRLSTLEKVNGYSLTVTDEFFKGAVYQSAINSYARLVEKGVLTQGEAERLATEQMLYNTFQDETAIGSALEWLHNGLNGTTKWFKDHDVPVLNKLEGLGLGDFAIKYRKVPGALVTRAIEFSPAGAIKAVHNLGHIVKYAREQSALETKMKVEGEQSVTDAEIEEVRAKLIDAQHAWSMSFARTLTGSAMVAVFAALASSGIIGNAEDEEDPDARAVNAAEGLSGTQINLSALGRWMRGQSTEWQAGDDLIDLGWLDPTGSAITMGTMIANAKDAEGENFFSRWFGANKGMIIQSFSDLSMMDTLNDLLYTLMYHDEESDLSMATEFAITFATSSLTSMWPSVFRQVAQATDRYYRDTYGGDGAVYDALRGFVGEDTAQAIQTAVNEVAVNIPGLRQTVDTKLDSFGRPKTYGDSTVANVLNALINPSKYAKYNPSEASRELRRVARETGDASIYPDRNAPSSLQFGNERIDLTPDQRRTWQTTMGQTYDQMVGEMMSGDAYQNADSEGKVKLLKDLESYVEYKARQEIYREIYGEEYSNDQWAKTEAGLDLGIEFGDMRKILEDTSEGNMPSLLDDNGETISGSREGQIMDYLNETAYDDETKLNLYGIIRGSGAASSTQKLREIMETGLSFEEASAVRQTYNELNATREPNLDGMRDRDYFEKYLRGEGYSDEQRQAITDRYKFYTQIPQEENASITKMVAGGMDYDTAYDIAAKISALEPEDGEDSVSTAQKYSSVIADSTLSVGEKQMAVAAIAGTGSKFGSLNEDIAENLMRVYEETGVTSVLSIQPADSVTVDYKEYKYTDEQYAASERAYLYVMNNMGGGYLTDAKLVSSAKDIASNAAKYAAMEAGGYAPDIDSSDYSAYRKASRAAELGLDLSYYVAVKSQGSSYTADKDANGDSISGSKKKKVLNYLSSLGLTSAQYTFFKKDVFGYS